MTINTNIDINEIRTRTAAAAAAVPPSTGDETIARIGYGRGAIWIVLCAAMAAKEPFVVELRATDGRGRRLPVGLRMPPSALPDLIEGLLLALERAAVATKGAP